MAVLRDTLGRWRARPAPGLVLLSPVLAILALMTIGPAFYIFARSVFNTDLMNPGSGRFVGLTNYANVVTNPDVWHDLGNTLLFVCAAVALELCFGLLLAILLSQKLLESNLVAGLLILPMAMTPAVSALIWRELLDPNFGWISYYLQAWHITADPIAWLSNTNTSWIALVGLNVWQWTPFVALILLAGLQGIPLEPKEAAAVDGANAWQAFLHITLPMLRPFIAIALLLRVIDAFKTFDAIQILTGGGPGTSTEVINLMIYRVALQDFNVGAASALGVCFLLVLAFVVQQLIRILSRSTDVLED
ncbi:MAG: carbohydrate transporter rane protein 1, family [Chloroflexi bacterium]|nr:carbohydrate transporter rane protein 1, family [Chloroflexota bacterium]